MSIGLLGKKIGMTQIFNEDGTVVPVTIVEAGPCFVLQLKTGQIDGYFAAQLGFEDKKESKTTKPMLAHFKKAEIPPKKFIREFRLLPEDKLVVGQKISVEIFKPGQYVDISGVSKGKGFQGGMKRWNWTGGKASHGSMHHRAPGSSGSNTSPGRVFKGHHFPGRMGQDNKTIQNLEVVDIDIENNIIAIKGSVPGANNGLIVINKAKKKTFKKPKIETRSEKPKQKEAKKPEKEKPQASPDGRQAKKQ